MFVPGPSADCSKFPVVGKISPGKYHGFDYRRGSKSKFRDSGRVRLLTNLQAANEKLLQIILVGQPELNLKLNSSD
jgi:hypothetical protein